MHGLYTLPNPIPEPKLLEQGPLLSTSVDLGRRLQCLFCGCRVLRARGQDPGAWGPKAKGP